MGDLELMRPAIIDMLGVFFLKVTNLKYFSIFNDTRILGAYMIHLQASSYEFVTESADQGSQAYWYLSKNRNRNFHRAKLLYVGTRWSTRLRTKAPFTLFSPTKPRRRTSPILEFVMAMSSCKFSCPHMYKSWVTNEIKIHFTDIFST